MCPDDLGIDLKELKSYSMSEVANLLGMSRSQVGKLVRSGRLRAVNTGFGRIRKHCRVSHEALVEFLTQSGKEVR